MFIPIKDDQPTIRTPHFTIALILINTVVFLFSRMLGTQGYMSVLSQYGYIHGFTRPRLRRCSFMAAGCT